MTTAATNRPKINTQGKVEICSTVPPKLRFEIPIRGLPFAPLTQAMMALAAAAIPNAMNPASDWTAPTPAQE